jgi:pilus assembly protein Flp/PilA
MRNLLKFISDDSGPTAVEYAVMLGLLVLVCLSAIVLVGQSTATSYDASNAQLEKVLKP